VISRLLVAASIAFALSAGAADRVTATQAWARATPPGASVGAAYVSIHGGAVADRLVAAHVDGAARVEFHEARNDDGIARMRPIAAVGVPAGARVVFAPNGLHLMLIGLERPLLVGEQRKLTLDFEHTGRLETLLQVRPATTDGAGAN
jgi:copper(I)-binding protein